MSDTSSSDMPATATTETVDTSTTSSTSPSASSLPPNRQYTVDASGKVIEEKEIDTGRTVKYVYGSARASPYMYGVAPSRIPVWSIVLIGALVGVLLLALISTIQSVKSMPSRPRWSSGTVRRGAPFGRSPALLQRPKRPSINSQLDIKRGELAMLEHAKWAARPYPTWSK